MQKLEAINTRQTLTESADKKEKKEKCCCDDLGQKECPIHSDDEPKNQPKGEHNESIVFTSSIARGLVEDFGYELEEETLDEAENPHANDPAKSAAWAALSPEDQKWLGGADPTDPYILARAPNKGKPAAPAGGAATKPAGAPELVGTQNQAPDAAAQADRIANRMDQEAGANTMGQAAAPAAPAAVDPAVAATREKFKALMDKLEKTGGVSGSAPAVPAKPTQVAPPKQPVTGAANKPSTGFANTGGGAAVGNPNMAKQGVAKESVSYGDDQILTIIKSIKY